MANLETLELTINANAESAKQGIDNLITSLSSLGQVVAKAADDMRRLNMQLLTLKSLGVKLPSVAKTTGASAIKGESITKEQALAMVNSSKSALQLQKAQGMVSSFVGNAQSGKLTTQQMAEQALQIKNATERYEKLVKVEKEEQQTSKDTVSSLAKLKQGFNQFGSGLTSIFSRIKRIAVTMLIRSAIRNLIKDIKEGITNVQEWSKTVGGEGSSLAKAMNSFKAGTLTMKNALGAMLSPVIQALIPLLNQLTAAIINAANWFNQFISLLSGKTSWTKAIQQTADDVTDATSAVGGAAKAAKEAIAAFDELNVLTTSSGSGSGGGTSQTTEDYAGMFEQISQFDGKIRELATFVEENLETIKTLALGVGTAILAWKLSKSFLDVLPTLSNIFGYVATGAAIAVTIGLTWMFANEYLQTGEDGWLWAEVLSTAVGTTAAAAMAAKLFKGKAGAYVASITLAFSALTGIVANVTNTDVDAFDKRSIQQNIIDALKAGAATGIALVASGAVTLGWALAAAGGVALAVFGATIGLKLLFSKNNMDVDSNLIHLTEEQIDEYVRDEMFTVDPKIFIDCSNTVLDEMSLNKKAIEDDIGGYLGTLNVINLGLANDDDYLEIKKQILGESGDGSGGLIGDINKWINSETALAKLALKFTPKFLGDTPEEQQNWFMADQNQWNTIKEYINNKGKELADEYVKGENGELIVKRPERVKTLLNEINTIAEILAGSEAKTELFIDFELKLQNMDAQTLSETFKTFNTYKEEAKAKAQEIVDALIAEKTRVMLALGEMLKADPNNPELKKQLEEAEEQLNDLKDNYKDKLDATIDDLTAPGRDVMAEWVENHFTKNTVGIKWTEEYLKEWLNTDGFEDTLKQIFTENGIDMTNVDINDFLSVGGWDVLTKDLQDKIIKNIEITPDTLKTLKEQCGVSAQELFAAQDWGSFSDKQKKNFVKAIADAYGSDEALKAAKAAGIDIGDALNDAVDKNVKDPKVGATADTANAKKAGETITSTVAKNTKNPDVKPTVNKDALSTMGTKVKGVFTKDYHVTSVALAKAAKSQIGADVTNASNGKTITKMSLAQDSKDKISKDIKKAAEGQKTKITAEIDVKKTSVFDAMKNIMRTVAKLLNIPVPAGFAQGGFPKSAQLFYARENGIPEMVGSMGGRTAVANNDQIVEGIASGVAAANTEQNNLLRQQNQILMGILQKSGNVTIGASSALGRVVNQSLQMYGQMTGV